LVILLEQPSYTDHIKNGVSFKWYLSNIENSMTSFYRSYYCEILRKYPTLIFELKTFHNQSPRISRRIETMYGRNHLENNVVRILVRQLPITIGY